MKRAIATTAMLSVGFWTCLHTPASMAEGSSHSGGNTRAGQGRSLGMEAVDPSGKRMPIPASSGYSFKIDRAAAGESVADVARRNGYVTDTPTLNALKRWNPEVQSVTRELGEGRSVHLVKPTDPSLADARVAVPRQAVAVSPMVFRYQGLELQRTRAMVDGAGLGGDDKRRLLGATDRVSRANQIFELQAPGMSPRQRVLAEAQVDLAGRALRSATVDPAALRAADSVAASAESYARMVTQAPRRLQVIVKPARAGQIAEPMDVYVLPIGLVEYGELTDVTKIRNVLQTLKFVNPTSPSTGDLEAGIPYAVWIGPRNATETMAQLVSNHGVLRYRSVDASRPRLDDLVFEESEKTRTP